MGSLLLSYWTNKMMMMMMMMITLTTCTMTVIADLRLTSTQHDGS